MEQSLHTTDRHWVLFLLFVVGALNLFDRQIINVLAQDIKVDLNISDTRLGLLTGTAFGLFYSLLAIPLGQLADRVNRVRLIGLAVALWSGFTVLCGRAGDFAHLFAARVGVGFGEAGSQPASTALIADIFPEGRRVSAMALMLAGAPAGSFCGLLLGGWVGSIWGWRTAFLLAGLPGLLVAAVMVATVRDPRALNHAPRKPDSAQDRKLVKNIPVLLHRPGYVWLLIGNVCSAILVYTSGAWLPAFFMRVHGMTTASIGSFAAVAVGIGGGLGTIGAGFICDSFRRRIRDIESRILIVGLALSIPLLFLTLFLPSRNAALVSMFLLSGCAYSFLSPIVTQTQRAATPDTRALSVAFMVSVGNIVSLAVGLPLVGFISDRLNPTFGVTSIRYAIAICAITGAIGAIAHARARCALYTPAAP